MRRWRTALLAGLVPEPSRGRNRAAAAPKPDPDIASVERCCNGCGFESFGSVAVPRGDTRTLSLKARVVVGVDRGWCGPFRLPGSMKPLSAAPELLA